MIEEKGKDLYRPENMRNLESVESRYSQTDSQEEEFLTSIRDIGENLDSMEEEFGRNFRFYSKVDPGDLNAIFPGAEAVETHPEVGQLESVITDSLDDP